MEKCKHCGDDITEDKKMYYRPGLFRKQCRPCYNEYRAQWAMRQRRKERPEAVERGELQPIPLYICKGCGKPTALKRGEPLCNDVCRFWSYVEKGDKCWTWKGGKTDQGYGRMWFKGQEWLAHRLMYDLVMGEDPGRLVVNHSCDNPSCVNPAHLWLGTQWDNIRDMQEKGRHPRMRQIDDCWRKKPQKGAAHAA